MAREVFETTGNDSLSAATNLGRVEDDPFVRGSFVGTDFFDVYKFTVDRPTQFIGNLFSSNGTVDADLSLLNSQGQLIKFSNNRGTTVNDIVQSDNLPAGEYFLSVSKSSGSGNYTLNTNGFAVDRAQLSVTVDRLTALDSFDPSIFGSGKPDFQINIGGQKSSKFADKNDVSPNFTVTKDFNASILAPSLQISVNEIDTISDDFVDIESRSGSRTITVLFDGVKGEAFGSSGFRVKENQLITVEGNGDNDGDARIQFRVNYNTFASSFSSFSSNTPVLIGNNASQTLTGQDLSGILCGEGGNDNLSGMGGNDALCGGAGNDTLNGGTGKDMSWGSAGRDIHNGGAGSDTFMLELNSGVDLIRDFQDGVDKLGLTMELNFEVLDITQQGKDTVIGAGSQRLAILANVKADQITADDFVTVGFTRFKGVEVPTLVA